MKINKIRIKLDSTIAKTSGKGFIDLDLVNTTIDKIVDKLEDNYRHFQLIHTNDLDDTYYFGLKPYRGWFQMIDLDIVLKIYQKISVMTFFIQKKENLDKYNDKIKIITDTSEIGIKDFIDLIPLTYNFVQDGDSGKLFEVSNVNVSYNKNQASIMTFMGQ